VGGARRVLVAGGDGTVGVVLRALAGTDRQVGLLPLGTFNNFARSLGIPEDLDRAIDVVRTGRPRPVTLGRVGDRPFLEIAAVGLFGELIVLGEAAKELAFGELGAHFHQLTELRPFRYRLGGDLEGRGTAVSLVFSNTPTTGAHVPIGDGTPDDPYLELTLGLSGARDVVTRLLAALLRRPRPGRTRLDLRFRRLVVTTDPVVPVYADHEEVGRTPFTVEAQPGAITVIEPRT
jgi:diacylglycerol kinase family enzyme